MAVSCGRSRIRPALYAPIRSISRRPRAHGPLPSLTTVCATEASRASSRQPPERPTQHGDRPQSPVARQPPQLRLEHRVGLADELLELAGGAAAEALDRLDWVRHPAAIGLGARRVRRIAIVLVRPPSPDAVLG